MRPLHLYLLLGLGLLPLCAPGETDQAALARAMAALEAAAPRARADPAHPIFHITAPAHWMNDPNGPIFYRGWYHLFYQLTPFSDESGIKYWGHVRSRDLVKWERLPVALAPSGDRGEESVWSGSCTINGGGRPMIFYTSIGRAKSAFDQAQQWAALGDDQLIHWRKLPDNPVLPEAINGPTKIYDWRDPFVFHDGQKTFLVTGGHLAKQGEAAVSIYEARNASLTKWRYRGVLFSPPGVPTAECPNFFPLGREWVLLVSPYGRVQYFLGKFDSATCRFTARASGLLDYGPNFYAPNTMLVPDGSRLVWGWINGFPAGRGWNGCLSLPRQLEIAHDGGLRQMPAPQLKKLRGRGISRTDAWLDEPGLRFPLPPTNALEIQADVDLESAAGLSMALESARPGAGSLPIDFKNGQLRVLDVAAPLDTAKLRLRIFLDRSVLEVFANDRICITKTLAPVSTFADLKIRSDGGRAEAQHLRAWPMKSIW